MPMQSETKGQVHVQEPHSPGNVATQHRPRRGWIIGLIVFLVFAGILVFGILGRIHTSPALRAVTLCAPHAASPSQELTLPGNVQQFTQSPIFARTNGYLKRWYFDIGAHVKKGQLLAVIDSPEVDQQLQQARSNLSTANANLELATITRDR